MAYIEETANAELHLIFGPYALQQKVPGVTGFQHVSEQTVTRRGQNNFGNTGPVAITDSYQGETGSITLEGAEAEKILAALLSGADPATFVTDNPKTRFPLYVVSNTYDDDGVTPIKGSLVHYAKFENTPRPVGPDARSYNFQAMRAKDFFGKVVKVQVFAGNATPVTVLTLGDTALADDAGDYAQLVLRQTENTKTVTILKKTTDYTEASGAVTLLSGLTATEKALVIYVKA